jgi:nucleoside-diphosphate-sugar epimerase
LKFYIIGSNGFVGKKLCERLEDLGHSYLGYTSADTLLNTKDTFDVIINCAAKIHEPDMDKMFQSNVALTYNLLTTTKYGRMIQIGSSSEYGIPTEDTDEDYLIKPFDAYSGTKAAASMLVKGFGGTVIRPFSLYGETDRETKFIPTLLRKLKNNEDIPIFEGSHDWVYIDDFIDAIMHIVDNNIHGEYDVSLGKTYPYTNQYVASTLKRISGSTSNIFCVDNKYRDYDREDWVGNSYRNPPGWKPKYELKEGLEKCWMNFIKE